MLEEHLVSSAILGRNRAVWLQRPQAGATDRMWVILDAENYLCNVGIGAILDLAFATGLAPETPLVFVPFVTPESRHCEYACDPQFARFLAEELPAWSRTVIPGLPPSGHVLFGLSLSGLQAVFTALKFPGVYHAVVSQSPSAWYRDEFLKTQVDPMIEPKAAIRISVGSLETSWGDVHQPGDLHQGSSQVASCGRLVAALEAAGHAVEHSVFKGDHDPEYWAGEMPEVLRWLGRQ